MESGLNRHSTSHKQLKRQIYRGVLCAYLHVQSKNMHLTLDEIGNTLVVEVFMVPANHQIALACRLEDETCHANCKMISFLSIFVYKKLLEFSCSVDS